MDTLESRFATARRSEPYLDGTGFTLAVMAELPRREELPTWIKNVILLAATAVGSAVAAWQLPPVVKLAGETFSAAMNAEVLALAALVVYTASLGVVWVARKEIL